MKYLIIGGVAGGATAAARLRRVDEAADIILLEKGKYISYANCGLPYYIGGVIEDRAKLLVQTPQSFGQRFRIDVRVENEAVAIDPARKAVTVRRADGITYEASVYDWYRIINGYETTAKVVALPEDTATDTDASALAVGDQATLVLPYSADEVVANDRLNVLAALEGAVLQNYNYIPLTGDSTAQLKGMQVEYYTEEQIYPMAWGGIKYMTYNYDDAAWEAYVAEQGGTLNYR